MLTERRLRLIIIIVVLARWFHCFHAAERRQLNVFRLKNKDGNVPLIGPVIVARLILQFADLLRL